MKKIPMFILLVCLAGGWGCPAHTGTPTPVSTFEACSTDAVKTAATAILGDVASALATGQYIAALADLATRFGEPEVVCAVQLAVNEFSRKAAGAPNDPVIRTSLAHGRAYLASKAPPAKGASNETSKPSLEIGTRPELRLGSEAFTFNGAVSGLAPIHFASASYFPADRTLEEFMAGPPAWVDASKGCPRGQHSDGMVYTSYPPLLRCLPPNFAGLGIAAGG